MRRRTLKRQRQEYKYRNNRSRFIEDQRSLDKRGNVYCIFCGNVIKQEEPDLHHGDGRDDEELLDESLWFLADNYCHVTQYHGMSCLDIPWWNDYVNRIKITHPTIYEKELRRQEKAEYGKRK